MTFHRGLWTAEVFAVFVALLLTQSVPAKAQFQTAQAQVENVRSAATRAATDWSATRNCSLPLNGTQLVGEKMTALAPAVSTKRLKYSLETERQNQVVMAFTTAYLDSLPRQAAQPGSCAITRESIQSTQFPPVFMDPDTGVLEVDGSQDKADIYIDGSKKGSIKQAFVLSAGKHLWKTMKCTESIQIAANDTRKVYCRKQ